MDFSKLIGCLSELRLRQDYRPVALVMGDTDFGLIWVEYVLTVRFATFPAVKHGLWAIVAECDVLGISAPVVADSVQAFAG